MNSSQSTGSSTDAPGADAGKNATGADHAGSPKAQAILDASLELFAEKGYDGTAVPLIAEKAGVGAGTIYRYFESKEVLVNILYNKWRTV
ncbi:MAG: helix-turn-helix domain-containing protein, partial [Leptospirales bacterium]